MAIDQKIAGAANLFTMVPRASLKALANSDGMKDDAKLREVASKFEAMLVRTLLKDARTVTGAGGLAGSQASPGGDIYAGMRESALADQIAASGRLGFADAIYRSLSGIRSAALRGQNGSAQLQSLSTPNEAAPSVQGAVAPIRVPSVQSADASAPEPSAPATLGSGWPSGMQQLAQQRNEVMERVEAMVNAARSAKSATESANSLAPNATSPIRVPMAKSWSSPEEFARAIWPAAKQAAAELGTAPEAVVAVAALETGWGKSMPMRSNGEPSFNLFGIKASRRSSGDKVFSSTLEFEQGTFKRKVEPFRAYTDPSESVADFARLIGKSKRYAKALESGGDPVRFVRELQAAGYATDPNYSRKLERVIGGATMRAAANGQA